MKLNTQQLNEQFEAILDFLKIVHEDIEETPFGVMAEIRPINRKREVNESGAKVYDYQTSKSFNFWEFNEKTEGLLKEFLKFQNENETCLYYSIYQFDSKAGNKSKRINKVNAFQTRTLVADFDDMSETDMKYIANTFNNLGIEPMWLFSGNGYQAIFLLKESTNDVKALRDFIYLLYRKGFPVDLNCVDPARVMRLPYTFNKKRWEEGITPLTKIVNDNFTRTTITQITDSLEVLPDMLDVVPNSGEIEETPSKSKSKAKLKKSKSKTKKSTKKSSTTSSNLINQEIIKRTAEKTLSYDIDLTTFQEPIRKMLTYVPAGQGLRNSTMGFLIGYLKNKKIEQYIIKDLMEVWVKEASDSPYDIDFEYEFNRFYKNNGLPYTVELTQIYGFIDFDEDAIKNTKNHVFLPELLFHGKLFRDMSPYTLRIILAAHLLWFRRVGVTVQSLAEIMNVSEKTVRRYLPTVLKTGFIFEDKAPVNLKAGEVKTYIISTIKGTKRVRLHNASLSNMIEKLKPNELKILLYIHFSVDGENNGRKFVTQKQIAEATGYEENNKIYTTIKDIHQKKDFLLVIEQKKDNHFKELSYISII